MHVYYGNVMRHLINCYFTFIVNTNKFYLIIIEQKIILIVVHIYIYVGATKQEQTLHSMKDLLCDNVTHSETWYI